MKNAIFMIMQSTFFSHAWSCEYQAIYSFLCWWADDWFSSDHKCLWIYETPKRHRKNLWRTCCFPETKSPWCKLVFLRNIGCESSVLNITYPQLKHAITERVRSSKMSTMLQIFVTCDGQWKMCWDKSSWMITSCGCDTVWVASRKYLQRLRNVSSQGPS